MGRRMVVPGLLICVAISVTGCWVERDAQGRLHLYGRSELKARERYLERSQPRRIEQIRTSRKTGASLLLLGGMGMGYGLAYMANRESWGVGSNDDEVATGVGLTGLIVFLVGVDKVASYGPDVRKAGRRHAQLLIGPNGCALVYRF